MNLTANKRIPSTAELQRQARLDTFSRTLSSLLKQKGLSEADLARAVFGERPTQSGGTEAIGRDRINLYVNGKQLPSQDVVTKLSKTLEFDFDKLIASEVENLEDLEFTVINVPGETERVLLRLSAIAPFDDVSRVVVFIREIVKAANRTAKRA